MGSQWDSFHKEESAIFILSLHASRQWATFKRKHIPNMRVFAYVRAKLLQSCPTLCGNMDCGQPGSSVRGISQARILEWVTIPSSRGSSQPRDGTHMYYISCIGRWILYHWVTREPLKVCSRMLKMVFTLCLISARALPRSVRKLEFLCGFMRQEQSAFPLVFVLFSN